MTTNNPSKLEQKKITERMIDFLEETYTPIEYMNPWELVNKYFAISDKFEENNKVYIRVDDKVFYIGEHSTLDVSNARNFIMYFRTVFRNKLKQQDGCNS